MPVTSWSRGGNPESRNVNNPAFSIIAERLNFFVTKLTIGIMYTNLVTTEITLRLN
jgi:hypothetical protein